MAGLGTGTGAPIVKVYHERSMILPDVSRVLACLYEKNVQFETVKDSYKDILRLQSTRSVPVPFYDGPTFRQESRAICRYIAETYEQRGYPFLLGKDVLERASIEQWLRHEEHAFDPPSRALFCHLAFPLQDEDMSDIDREKRKLEEVLEVYEQRLGESEFLAGNKFTLADLVHLPNTYHIVESEFAYLYDSRKNVQRWWNTISARDSWQQVMRDMQSVEEQNQIKELEQQQLEQQWQWETEPPPTSGQRILRIDPRQQTGTESRTVLVPPPSGGAISSSFFTVQQGQQPLPTETTSHAPNQRKKSNLFTTTKKTPAPSKQGIPTTQEPPSSVQSTTSNFFSPATPPTTTKISPKTGKDKFTTKDASSPTKTSQRSTGSFFTPPITTTMPQRANTDKSTSKDASSPTRPSQGSSIEAPDKLHLSDFYKASSHADETAIITKPTPKEASKTSDRISAPRQTSEVVSPDKPSPASPKTPSGINGPERKPTSIDSWDSPVPYTKPGDSQTPRSPDTRSAAQRDAGTSGPDAGERPSNQRSVVQTPYAQRPSEQAKKVTDDQRAASKFPEHVAAKDIQGETAQVRYRDARDSTKEAREADQKRAASATTRQLPSGSQIIPQQAQAPPTSLKASDLSPVQEGYEDTQGEDERFSTKRLRKMIEQSDPAALKSQPTDLPTPPIQGETPSILKNSSYVQDRKGQAGNSSADGKTDGTVSNGTRDPGTSSTVTRHPDTPTTAATRATSPPKGGMAPDGRGASATEPRESQSINEQQPAPPMPSQSPTTAGVDRREQPRAPNKTSTEQSDKSSRQMGQQKMQNDKSSISPQDNGKQGSEAALLTNADQNSGKTPAQALQESQRQTSPDTQHVKNNRSNSTSDGSSKPTRQFDGNEGDAP